MDNLVKHAYMIYQWMRVGKITIVMADNNNHKVWTGEVLIIEIYL